MRTTLKRGMGRAATLNGNGRAVLPPPVARADAALPAAAAAAALDAARSSAQVFGWLLLAIVVVASGLAGGVYLYGHETLERARAALEAEHQRVEGQEPPSDRVADRAGDRARRRLRHRRKGSDAAAGRSRARTRSC